ncbi:MAG: glycosyltransferase family 1 protein [bacterium]
MRIGIDARMYDEGGVGRYIKQIIAGLERLSSKDEFYVFVLPSCQWHPTSARWHRVETNIRWYTIKEQMFLPFILFKYRLDIMHFPQYNVPLFYNRPFVITIHDVIEWERHSDRVTTLPVWWFWIKMKCMRLIWQSAVKRARKILTVSHWSKEKIADIFDVRDKITVTYLGVDQLIASKRQRHPGNFLLYVGTAYPHKNLEFLVNNFRSLLTRFPYLNLTLVGDFNFFYQRLEQYAVGLGLLICHRPPTPADNGMVCFTSKVSDDTLSQLYATALVFVMPSLEEGFGLPPVEALLAGCPVMSSNASCLPEILQNQALFFDPYSQQDFMVKFGNFLEGKQKYEQLAMESEAIFLSRFSWERCVSKTYEAYQQTGT